jgi:hypothetical protein
VLRCSCCTRLISPAMACVSSVVAAWADVWLEARVSASLLLLYIYLYIYIICIICIDIDIQMDR